ncbi:MAG: DUF6056 family protein [Bacteroidales bacterium]|nr:DUF6056 family protein [Bacteroidales bacterium]
MLLIKNLNLKVLILFILSLMGFFVISFFSNLAYDDFNYKFIFDANGATNKRVESLSDIFYSQYHHYFVHSGRVLIHTIVQFFLMFDNKIWFDIANTLVFGLLQILILRSASISKSKINVTIYLLLILSLWFVIPGQNYCMFWLSGSVNYLWSVTLALLLFYFHGKSSSSSNISKLDILFYFFLGIILNATHEVLSIGISISFIFHLFVNWRKICGKTLAISCGAILSAIFTAISPANFKMAAAATSSPIHSIQSVMESNESHIFIALVATKIFIILLIIGFILFLQKRQLFFQLLRENHLYLIAMVISLIFAYMVNAFSQRAIFPASILALVILLTVARTYINLFRKTSVLLVLLIGAFFMLFEYRTVVDELVESQKSYQKIEHQMLKSDVRITVFEDFKIKKNRFVCYTGLGNQNRYWISNEGMSRLFDKPYIVFLPNVVVNELLRRDNLLFDNVHPKMVYFKQTRLILLECPTIFTSKIGRNSFVQYGENPNTTNHDMVRISSVGCCSTQFKTYLFFHVPPSFIFDKNYFIRLVFHPDFPNRSLEFKVI